MLRKIINYITPELSSEEERRPLLRGESSSSFSSLRQFTLFNNNSVLLEQKKLSASTSSIIDKEECHKCECRRKLEKSGVEKHQIGNIIRQMK